MAGETQGQQGDPTRDMVSRRRYERLPDGTPVSYPIGLAEEADKLRRLLTHAHEDEATIDNDWTTGVVEVSRSRGMAIAALLGELSARVRPGTVTGPIVDGDALADLAEELAGHLDVVRTATESGY